MSHKQICQQKQTPDLIKWKHVYHPFQILSLLDLIYSSSHLISLSIATSAQETNLILANSLPFFAVLTPFVRRATQLSKPMNGLNQAENLVPQTHSKRGER